MAKVDPHKRRENVINATELMGRAIEMTERRLAREGQHFPCFDQFDTPIAYHDAVVHYRAMHTAYVQRALKKLQEISGDHAEPVVQAQLKQEWQHNYD